MGIPITINTWYVVKDNEVYIIDTGIEQYAELQIKVAQLLGEPKAIYLTHGHVDHIGAAKQLKINSMLKFMPILMNLNI